VATAVVREGSSIWFVDHIKVGTTVPVRYERDDPAGARLATWAELWVGPVFVTSWGALFVAIGAFAVFKRFRSSD
jgi:hypothetical protein